MLIDMLTVDITHTKINSVMSTVNMSISILVYFYFATLLFAVRLTSVDGWMSSANKKNNISPHTKIITKCLLTC
jgi:hypothetical protein